MASDGTATAAPDVLQRILAHKEHEVAEAAKARPQRELEERAREAEAPRGLRRALAERVAAGEPALIAEIKKASPSKGVLRENFDPGSLARAYRDGGAVALSVLTDRGFFGGSGQDLATAREAVALPALRKDFLIDSYQIIEARAMGADCVLLIVAALGDARLRELRDKAVAYGMDVLVEVHDGDELERALAIDPDLVGINNRDLRTLVTDTTTTRSLRERVPEDVVLVTESGIHSADDLARMQATGVHAFLVGEALMSAPDPGARLAELFRLDPT
jgi:indole-3-glycerol phosphate synthase